MMRGNDYIHEQTNEEPNRFIRTEPMNKPKGFLFINSENRNKQYETVNDFRLVKNGTINSFNMSEVSRIACDTVHFFWRIPNINPRNNKIVWEQGGQEYTAFVPEGWYNHLTLAPAIQSAMNAQIAGSVVTTLGQERGWQMVYNGASAVTFKETGLKRDILDITGWSRNDPQTEFTGIVPQIYYTRWIDVISPTLNTYQRIRDEDSNGKNTDVIIRIFTDDNETIDNKKTYKPTNVLFVTSNPKWMVYVKSRELGDIELRLRDEFGDPPYISPTYGSSEYSLILQTEG